jgi:hypothetical protein
MEIIKYVSGVILGVILAVIYYSVFNNKGLGIEFVTDTKIEKEYVTVFKDTCSLVQNEVVIRNTVRKGKPVETVVNVDTIIEDNDTTIMVDDRLRKYVLSSREGFVSVYDTLSVKGYYLGSKRTITLDTMEINRIFTNTVVVNPERTVEYVPVETKYNTIMLTGTIYSNRDYGLGLMYKTKGNYTLNAQYNMISKTISLTVGTPIIKWK